MNYRDKTKQITSTRHGFLYNFSPSTSLFSRFTCCEKSKSRRISPYCLLKWSSTSIARNLQSSAVRCTLDQLFQISISTLPNETGAAPPSEIFPSAKFLPPTFQTTPLPSRLAPSRQSNPNKTRHWHISERGTLKMKALRLSEARSPAGEILNYPYPNPRRVISLSPGAVVRRIAAFLIREWLRGEQSRCCANLEEEWEERKIYSRGTDRVPAGLLETLNRGQRERETPDLNISTRRATFAREGAHGRSLNNFIRAVNTPKIKDRKRHFPAKVICSVS